MEERVKRIERSNRILIVGFILFLVIVGGSKAREFFGRTWLSCEGVVTDSLSAKRIDIRDLTAEQSIPRIIFSMDSNILLSFIDSTHQEMLGIGIRKDPQLGEIPYISFRTKSGVNTLEPNEDGKVEWVTR